MVPGFGGGGCGGGGGRRIPIGPKMMGWRAAAGLEEVAGRLSERAVENVRSTGPGIRGVSMQGGGGRLWRCR
jgi:hypothetical protein